MASEVARLDDEHPGHAVADVHQECHVIARTSDFVDVDVEDLEFPRTYVRVTSAYSEPTSEVRELADDLREHVRIRMR